MDPDPHLERHQNGKFGIRIRHGNKMMPIHNTAHINARTDTIQGGMTSPPWLQTPPPPPAWFKGRILKRLKGQIRNKWFRKHNIERITYLMGFLLHSESGSLSERESMLMFILPSRGKNRQLNNPGGMLTINWATDQNRMIDWIKNYRTNFMPKCV